MNVYKRIRMIRDHANKPQIEFAIYCNLKGSQITNLENEKQKASIEVLEAIAEKFPQFRIWLLTGEEFPEVGQVSPMTEQTSKKLKA